jgi:hypothetical protein
VALRKVYRYRSVIRRRKKKKYEQDNDQMKKDKGTNESMSCCFNFLVVLVQLPHTNVILSRRNTSRKQNGRQQNKLQYFNEGIPNFL